MHLRIPLSSTQTIVLDEEVLVRVVRVLGLAEVPPAAADEVSDDHGDDDEAQNLINIE